MHIFCKNVLTSAKLREPRHYKVYFIKLHMGVYLRAKFEVSSIILISFRQVGNFTPPPLPQNEPLKSAPRSGLNHLRFLTFIDSIY